MIYNFIKFVFTALFCIISFFVCGLYKLCKKEEEEEEEGESRMGRRSRPRRHLLLERRQTHKRSKASLNDCDALQCSAKGVPVCVCVAGI
jgi:hypothetical protein